MPQTPFPPTNQVPRKGQLDFCPLKKKFINAFLGELAHLIFFGRYFQNYSISWLYIKLCCAHIGNYTQNPHPSYFFLRPSLLFRNGSNFFLHSSRVTGLMIPSCSREEEGPRHSSRG